MRQLARLFLFSSALAALFVACGSRTGLPIDDLEATSDAAIDATVDVGADRGADAPPDRGTDAPPLREGGRLDASPDCDTPAFCDPKDPGKIFKCGVAIFQCSSLEQCAETGSDDTRTASCVNPCTDTLGQDTSNGCEFYSVEIDAHNTVAGACFAVFVVNQWKTGEPARIEVSRGGNVLPIDQFARIPSGTGTGITYGAYDSTKGLAKDQIAILFLSRDPAALNDPDPGAPRRLASCPPGVTPAVLGDAAIHGTGRGTAFRIKTNVPVVAYQMLPYGAGRARVTSATLLLPTNVWDDNYVAANGYAKAVNLTAANPTLAILGKEDGTRVTIRPTSTIVPGGGLGGTAANASGTYLVNRGEYLQFTQDAELSGSAIQADRAIAVIGGSQLMDIPVDKARADTGEQMLPPVRALGSEYVGVRYRGRRNRGEEVVPWRVVGVVDGTTLAFDPPQPGLPTSVNARQVIEFQAPGPFVVASQDADHPFYFAQYMTGGKISPGFGNEIQSDGEGDPEFVNVITPRQYLPRYTFFTDPTYPETNLVVTRVRDRATGLFPDVRLGCAGLLSGWQPIGGSGRFEFTRIDLSTGDFQGQNGCQNGVHTIEAALPSQGDGGPSPTPFVGVTIWGWGNPITWPGFGTTADESNPRYTRWVSYGYPAGANITRLNNVVLPAR